MVRKRIIFTLIYSNGFFMQSRNFRLQKVGNITWLERNYKFEQIAFSLDELVVLNATKAQKSIKDFAETITQLVNDVFIPIAAGGGIRSMEDAELLFRSGADKLIVNTILHQNPELVIALSKRYGAQSIVASVDFKVNLQGLPEVYIKDGSELLQDSLEHYVDHIQTLNIGEVYLNSIDKDGTGFGYDFSTIKLIAERIKVPLIIAGGAGNEAHLIEGLRTPGINAVATANLFNFIGDGLPIARKKILASGENIANWNAVH